MTAILLCILACGITWWAGRRSLGGGVVSALTFGYFYGIVRANVPSSFSHFIFDAALLGLYIAQKDTLLRPGNSRNKTLRLWIAILLLWPLVLVFIPFQPWLIQLVGLRGCAFFLPMAILGAEMGSDDVYYVCKGLAVLNVAVLGFAIAEYFLGVTRFFPMSEVTELIYVSNDVAGGFNRIPATFGTSHLFGGTMTATIPFLIGGWYAGRSRFDRLLSVAGLVAAFCGVLLSATRSNFIVSSAMVIFTVAFGKIGWKRQVAFCLVILGVGVLAMRNERLQRFETLKDTDYIQERIAGSVNRGTWEILTEYPLGNGLGGGGTSIPYFLQGQVRHPVATENEFGRISLEQGMLGLVLWLSFLAWFIAGYGPSFGNGVWRSARKLVWFYVTFSFCTAWIGNGLLTAIPITGLIMMGLGWVAVPMREETRPRIALTRRRTDFRPARATSVTPA